MGIFARHKKAPLWGAFFFTLAMLSPAGAACPVPAGLTRAAVARVVDGDTLKLADGRRLRLVGVNAPELPHQGRPAEPYGEAASRRVRKWLAASGNQVELAFGEPAQDRYGRLLAHVYDPLGRSLEEALLGEGLAYRVAVAPDQAMLVCLRQAEKRARSAGLGLWSQVSVLAPEQIRQGGFALIRGRIRQVERNGGGLWLDMDGPLVLQIPSRVLGRFGDISDKRWLERLAGRWVEARGWLVDRRRIGVAPDRARWMLPIGDPSMLELLP